MQTILTVFHIFLAGGLVGLILIQHGKGADMGAAFGSGASGTVFGAKGSASFLTRTTALLATVFFITSMVMAYFASQRNEQVGVMEALDQAPGVQVEEVQQSDIPPVPVESDIPAIAPAAEPAEAVPAVEAVTPVAEPMTSEEAGSATAEESTEQVRE
ncbi:MAG: preprotein translocase subunit SecG [gamma proteobacterium symbiont of Ctena orbiculata]|nr:MAG: preprotein translocase subunit SecG [gamma proteobacterium symbiont of Ctena orbiculata]